MSLSSLPIELQLGIVELLDPKSCFNFACTCNEYFHVFASLVARHKRFWERYHTIDAGAYDAGRLVWDVTKELLEEPRRATYVEDISLPENRQKTWDNEANTFALMPLASSKVPEEFVQIYMAAVKTNPVLNRALEKHTYNFDSNGTTGNIEEAIRLGADEPILAILLSQASELGTFRFTDAGLQVNELFQMVQGIAMAYGEPARSLSLPFQKLKYVAIAHHGTKMCCHPS